MCAQTIGRPMEILLVEDNLIQARVAAEAINRSEFQHRTTLVCDGAEALDFVFQRGRFRCAPRPDVILLDLRLPKFDGLDVLAEIKIDEELREIPVVIMTSSDETEDRTACERWGVDAYLRKPVNQEKFLALLRELKRFWHTDIVLPATISQA